MKKFLVLFTAVVIAFTTINCAFAWDDDDDGYQRGPKGPRGAHRESFREKHKEEIKKHKEEIKRRLKLTEEQKVQAKAIRQQARPKIEPIIEQMHKQAENILEMKQSGASQEEIKSEIEKMKALGKQANEIREENIKKFEAILNEEQKAEFKKIKAEVKQKKGEFRSKRKGRGFRHHKMEMEKTN